MKKLRVEIKEKLEMNSYGQQHLEHKGRIYQVSMWQGSAFVITDITNAGKKGTKCNELSVNADYAAPDCAIWNDLLTDHTPKLLEATTSQVLPPELEKPYLKFYFRNVESKRLLAVDLSTIKPLTEEPKKWTLPHVVRAIVNRQFSRLVCKYHHRNDTDLENYGDGLELDPIEFAKELVEHPSGWWTAKNGNGTVSICCHTFKSNEFTPVINPESCRTEGLEQETSAEESEATPEKECKKETISQGGSPVKTCKLTNLQKMDKRLRNLHKILASAMEARKENINAYDDDLQETWTNFRTETQKLQNEIRKVMKCIETEEENGISIA